METILRGLSAGFIVGVICVLYVVLRIMRWQHKLEAKGVDLYKEQRQSTTWMLMAIFSSGSIVWSIIGAGIYWLVQNHYYFMLFSICTAIILSCIVYFKTRSYRFDKIVLTLIMTIGLGVLIPYLIP